MSLRYRMILPVCHEVDAGYKFFWLWVEIWGLYCSLSLLDLCVMALFCCLYLFLCLVIGRSAHHACSYEGCSFFSSKITKSKES